MVVSPSVLDDPTTPEELVQHLQCGSRVAACVTENSCWTCQPSLHPALRTTEIEKQPSPSTKPTTHCSNTWSFLLIDRTGRIFTAHAIIV